MNSKMNTRRSRIGLICLAAVALAGSFTDQGRATAPPGRYTIANGTVHDTKTNLTWEQVSPSTFTWADAQAHCANLVLDGNGWRLPSMKELQTIVDDTRIAPAIDTAAFLDGTNEEWWTSSPMLGTSVLWLVWFSGGRTSGGDATELHRVRCVR